MRLGIRESKLLAPILLLITSACEGGATTRQVVAQEPEAQPAVQQPMPTIPQDTAIAARLSAAFRAATDRAMPAVVFVRVERQQRSAGRNRDPFRFFFGPPPPGGRDDGERLQEASGSGFIIDGDGHIMTNNHVVADASRVSVLLADGREFEAEIVGQDPNSDVAVIQISTGPDEELPVSVFGDSDGLRVGDWVLALGNPLGLQFTVTAGIVSAKGRSLNIGRRQAALEAFIQTDAAINPGNSGGPLVDLYGRVVGMNTAITGPRFVGYGFAIPISLANRVAGDLIRDGVVHRPQLGVRISDVDAVDAEVYGLAEVTGAEVVAVEDGGPAASAGIQIRDVIVEFDGEQIDNSTDLITTIAERRPGQTVPLTLIRDGQRRNVQVTLGEFEAVAAKSRTNSVASSKMENVLGFRVAPLDASTARELGYDRTEGVVISRLSNVSPAARRGLRRGQLLLSVNGREVGEVADVEELADEIDAGAVVSLIVLDSDLGETVINYRTRQ